MMGEEEIGRQIYDLNMTSPISPDEILSPPALPVLNSSVPDSKQAGNAFAALGDEVLRKSFSGLRRPELTRQMAQLNYEEHLAIPMPPPIYSPLHEGLMDDSIPRNSSDAVRKSSDASRTSKDSTRRFEMRSPTTPSFYSGTILSEDGEKKMSRMEMLKSKLSFKDLRKDTVKAGDLPALSPLPPLPAETAYTHFLRSNSNNTPLVSPSVSSLRASSNNTPMYSPGLHMPASCQSLRANLNSPLPSPYVPNPPTIESLRASSNGTVTSNIPSPNDIHVEKRRPYALTLGSFGYPESPSISSRFISPGKRESDKSMDKKDPSTPSTTNAETDSFSTDYSPAPKHVLIPNPTLEFRPKSNKTHTGKSLKSQSYDVVLKTPPFPDWFDQSDDYVPSFKERLEKAGLPGRPTMTDAHTEELSKQLVVIIDKIGSLEDKCDLSVGVINKKADDLESWIKDLFTNHMAAIDEMNRSSFSLLKRQSSMIQDVVKSQIGLHMEVGVIENRLATFERRTLDAFDEQITLLNEEFAELGKKVDIVTEKVEGVNLNKFSEQLQEQREINTVIQDQFSEKLQEQREVNIQIQEDFSQLKTFLGEDRLTPAFQAAISAPTQGASSTNSSPLLPPFSGYALDSHDFDSEDIQALPLMKVPEPPAKIQRSATISKDLFKGLGVMTAEDFQYPNFSKLNIQKGDSKKASIAGSVVPSPIPPPKDKKFTEPSHANEEPKRWNIFGFRRRHDPAEVRQQDMALESPTAASSHNVMVNFLRSPSRHAGKTGKASEETPSYAADSFMASLPEIQNLGFNPAYNTAAHPVVQAQNSGQPSSHPTHRSPPAIRSSSSVQIRPPPYAAQNEIRSVASFDGESHQMRGREFKCDDSYFGLASPLSVVSPVGNSTSLLNYYHETQDTSSLASVNNSIYSLSRAGNRIGNVSGYQGINSDPCPSDDWSDQRHAESEAQMRQREKVIDDWVSLTQNEDKPNEKQWRSKK